MNSWRRLSGVRGRLTLWYTLALGSVLVVYAVTVFTYVRHALYADLDRQLDDDIELIHESLEPTDDGRLVWRVAGHSGEADETTHGHRWLEVWSREGHLLLRTAVAEPLGLAAPTSGAAVAAASVQHGARWLRVLVGPEEIAGVPVLVRAARAEDPLRHQLRQMLMVQGIGIPVALVLASIGGYQLARRALAPVGRMAEAARRISAEQLSERLPVENPSDELGYLAAVFNDAFARLERSFEQMRRFTADASHELRTPLTALRSVGEVGLQERPDDKLFAEVVGSMLEEADRLTRLVDMLLTLSRADAGQLRLGQERIELLSLARDVVAHLEDLAEEKEQPIQVEGSEVSTQGDWLVLRQAVVNVVDNAIKYSPSGVPIHIRVGGDSERSWIAVSDGGPGIAPEHRERIFERFYRVDKARSRDLGGTGLGLSLAQWAVEAHGGRIEVESEVERGSTFRLVLPAAD